MRADPHTLARWAAAAAALALPGCISKDPGPTAMAAMCESSTDCDQAAGEVCDEGVCWGDPPDSARFAALLVPPASRSDLSAAVLPLLSISSDGTVAGLDFPEAAEIHGRVLLACPGEGMPYVCGDDESVAAQIRIERAPSFTGGPASTRLIDAAPAIGPGNDAFSFLLPIDPDAEYRITIIPDDAVGGEAIAPGEIAPPRQITVTAESTQRFDWVLGDPAELKTIRGCVENVVGDGTPYAGMSVVAFGRWTNLSELERASSRSITGADGCFELSVPRKMLDEFDITVAPPAGAVLPTITLRGEYVRDPAEGEQAVHTIDPPLIMPIAPAPASFHLPLTGRGSNGDVEPVVGADVRFTTVFAPPDPKETRDVEITFTAQAVASGAESKDPGVAEVMLYPGDEASRSYLVSVVTPAASQLQSVYQREVMVGPGGNDDAVLAPLNLERRTAVTGTAHDENDDPVVNAPMQARPSALFRQRLDHDALEQAVAELPLPTTTTDGSGGFVLWLDGLLVGEAAAYDIDVTPPLFSGAPSWSFPEVAIPPSVKGSVDLGVKKLPGASFARAVVRDHRGEPVPDAEVDIYQLPPDDYCTEMSLGEGECEPAARLRGAWRSDEEGVVRVVLPDP